MAAKEQAQEVLAQEILDDGRRRAERIRADAQAEAEKLLNEGEGRAKAEAARIAAEGEETARKRAQMIRSSVAQEIAQRKLAAREEVIQEVLAGASKELEKLEGAVYRNAVVTLAAEALRQMPGQKFVVRVAGLGEAECATIRDTLLKTLRDAGRTVEIQCAAAAGGSRGVVVESADGRLRWDNSFAARLNRMKAGLRRTIAPVLFGKL